MLELTVIVPVDTVHVGCDVTEAVGADGIVGCALTVTLVALDTHPVVDSLAVKLYVPAATLVSGLAL